MESSSENSFAWTDTSSDSTSMAADDANEKSDNHYDFDNDKKKKKKMSPTSKIASDGSILIDYKEDIKGEHSNKYSDTRSVNKKMIKLEPVSDNDRPKKKKKIKHNESNENKNETRDSICYDETYLNMKVKQEQLDSLYTKHKQKEQIPDTDSKNHLTSSEIYQNDSINENIQESEYDNHSKKKKKKAKRKYDSEDNVEMTSKVDIDETIVNKTFYEENEESGCDEISAIKYDDEHNHHTNSIINQSLQDVNKRRTDNSLDETTITQYKLKNSSHMEENHMKKPEATRMQRISDRIRFEDDDDIINGNRIGAHENDFENSKKSAKIEQFVRANSNLRLLSKKLDNNTRLTSDDEIWILKCPKDIDIKDFRNTNLNVHSKCKIKIAGQTYDGSAEEEHSSTVPLLTIENNKYKIRSSALSGIVNLRKRIPKAHFHDHNIMVNNQTNFIPLPDTKCRHPLFGSNYKKALKIPIAIAERLKVQDIQESVMKVERRKKKKDKKDRNKTDTVEQVNPQVHYNPIMKLESNDSVGIAPKKKNKRKFIDDESPPKKLKRTKHNLESAEAWESEKAIEENLFNF